LRYAKGDFTITIKAQSDVQRTNDPRVLYDFINPDDQNNLYEGFDALILPRRYAGQSLPMCEALCAGLPVVMTDIDPNNKVLPPEWLVGASRIGQFMVRTMIDVYNTDPRKLAIILDTLEVDAKAKAKAIELSREYDPDTLLSKYTEVLGL
jgi:glycosyltransferase involved in cell wall biosynthesis